MSAPGRTLISAQEDRWKEKSLHPELASQVAALTTDQKPPFTSIAAKTSSDRGQNRTLGNRLPRVA